MKLLSHIIFAFIVAFAVSSHTYASELPEKGGEVPFPWGSELPFPWQDIEGTWLAKNKDYYTWYTFKVVHQHNSGEAQIIATQMDPEAHQIVAQGAGFESDRIVSVLMQGFGVSYFMSIRAYLDKSMNRSVKVLSISSINNEEDWLFHFVLTKISENPVCGGSQN